MNKRDSGN